MHGFSVFIFLYVFILLGHYLKFLNLVTLFLGGES
jgi:hypothetical protein